MKTSQMILIGIAGYVGYKMVSGGQSGTSGGGSTGLGGLNLTMPNITLPGGQGLNLSLGNLGGDSGLSGILEALKTMVSKVVPSPNEVFSGLPGVGAITDVTDALKKIKDATSQVESVISDAQKKVEDFFKNALNLNLPESLIPKMTEKPKANPDDTTDQTTPIDILGAARSTIKTAGRIGIENYIGAFLTGSHIVRPLPLAKGIEELGLPIVEKAGITIGEKLSWRFGEKIGATVGSKVIPGIGWLTLLADPFADLARLFGVDVPEWLGYSPLLSLGNDTNVLERWVKDSEIAANARQSARVSLVESNTDMTTAHADFPVTFPLSNLEAHTGAPEAPSIGVRETRSAVDIHREQERTLERVREDPFYGNIPGVRK
jgi:hypothetical protein